MDWKEPSIVFRFQNILALEVDDALVFDTSSVMVEDITELCFYI